MENCNEQIVVNEACEEQASADNAHEKQVMCGGGDQCRQMVGKMFVECSEEALQCGSVSNGQWCV